MAAVLNQDEDQILSEDIFIAVDVYLNKSLFGFWKQVKLFPLADGVFEQKYQQGLLFSKPDIYLTSKYVPAKCFPAKYSK